MSIRPAKQPIPGIDRTRWSTGCMARGHRHVIALPEPAALPALIRETAHAGDIVVCLGAGSITNWANALPRQLEALAAGQPLPLEAGE